MIQKVLTYLLVTMIAMQSFVAIADVHQPHQSGEQHLEFEHAHGDSAELNVSSEPLESTSLDEYDCHHCCHCHGVNYLKTAGNGDDVFPYKQHLFLTASVDYLSYTPSPDIRPPIV
ncbi:hypothetical protein A9Q81_10465 [Gammaproteobacteria bacterium 42_54_T18]|nr:hypothetical protein A9Q81_10465 [Gammaproteobacteria bacterium 42_54_T18]